MLALHRDSVLCDPTRPVISVASLCTVPCCARSFACRVMSFTAIPPNAYARNTVWGRRRTWSLPSKLDLGPGNHESIEPCPGSERVASTGLLTERPGRDVAGQSSWGCPPARLDFDVLGSLGPGVVAVWFEAPGATFATKSNALYPTAGGNDGGLGTATVAAAAGGVPSVTTGPSGDTGSSGGGGGGLVFGLIGAVCLLVLCSCHCAALANGRGQR